jgi:hypothetical protein
VLGAFFLVLWLGIAVLMSLTMGQGELGTSRQDAFGENVRVTDGQPLGVRVLSASVDPANSVLDSISVYLNLQTNRSREEMWLAAIRLDDGGQTVLPETSPNVFRETLPEACLRLACQRTYVLVACWRKPTTEDAAVVYFGGNVSAERRSGTPPGSVALDVTSDRLPDDLANSVASASGCEAAP